MFPLLFTFALLHPVHETVTEIEWNAQTGRLEVALRLDVLDEQWLRKRGEHNVEDSKWRLDYLRRKFRVTKSPSKGQPDGCEYHWVGRHEEGSHVWWYFEIALRDKQPPTWVDQRVLFEREENYTHRILILDQVPRRSLTLTIQRPKANLDEAVNETNARESNSTPSNRPRD